MDFDLNDEEPSHDAELVSMPDMGILAKEAHGVTLSRPTLRSIEDKIFDSSVKVIEDMHSARDIDPAEPEPPAHWVRALGAEEAAKRFRVAKAAWLSANKAPVFLSLATKTAAAIMKARANQASGPRELNLQVQFIHAPMAVYETKKVSGR